MGLLGPAAHADPDAPSPVYPTGHEGRHIACVLHRPSYDPDGIGHIALAARTGLGDDLNTPEAVKGGLSMGRCGGCKHGHGPQNRGEPVRTSSTSEHRRVR